MFIKRFIKKQVTLAIITFCMLGVVIFGSSYALFQKTFVDEKTQSIGIGDLNIVFSNGTKENDEYVESDPTAIDLTNAMPRTDAEAIADDNDLYSFVIYNSGSLSYCYTISLVDNEEETNTISHNYLRYRLNEDEPELLGNKTNGIIYDYTINPQESHTFTLKVWLAEAGKYNLPNEVLGGEAHLNIVVEGEACGARAPKGWQYAKEGTLLAGIKGNQAVVNSDSATGMTTPGVDAATTDEGLREAPDDYGTSYYYRGDVQNNYVVFNNMCWRIVRIDGNGNIKLILQNERYSETGSCEVSDYNYNYARWNGSSTTTAFNNVAGVYNTASGSGFMYGNAVPTGTTDVEKYFDAQANTTASTLLTRLQDWYDRVFTDSNVINNLADVIWCGDKSLNRGVGYGNTYSNYGAFLRLITQKAPSLKCPTSDKINGELGNLSKYTAQSSDGNGLLHREVEGVTKYYPIGLITADEAAFAGGVYNIGNNTYYLYNGHYYWTMSPFTFNGYYASVWDVNSTGSLYAYNVVVTVNVLGLRPSIALKPDVKYTIDTNSEDAPGTVNNPFIVS